MLDVDVVLCPYIKGVSVVMISSRLSAGQLRKARSCQWQHPTESLPCILLDVARYQCTILSGYDRGFDLSHSLGLWVAVAIEEKPQITFWSEAQAEPHRLVQDVAWFPINPLVSEAAKQGLAMGFLSVRHFLMILYEMWNIHLKLK